MKAFDKPLIGTLSVLLIVGGAMVCSVPLRHELARMATTYHARLLWETRRTTDSAAGAPVAQLRIPRCRIDTLVLQGNDPRWLMVSPCVQKLDGMTVISGHRDKHFRRLSLIRTGDMLEVESIGEVIRHYRVVETEIIPRERAAGRIIRQRGSGWLVLTSCYPFHYIGPAPQRFIVWAVEDDHRHENHSVIMASR